MLPAMAASAAGKSLLESMRDKKAAAAAQAEAAAQEVAAQEHPHTPQTKRQKTAGPNSQSKQKAPQVAKPLAQAPQVAKSMAQAPQVAKPMAQAPQVAKPVAQPDLEAQSVASTEAAEMSQSVDASSQACLGVEPLCNDVAKQRRANWAKFMRSQEPAVSRSAKSDKMPADAALKLLAAGHEEKSWFNLWCEAGGSWGKCLAMFEESRATIKRTSGIDAWLTRDQLVDLYKSEAVGDAIRTKKLKDGRFTVPSLFIHMCTCLKIIFI